MALYPPLFQALVVENGKLVLHVDKANDPEQIQIDPYLGGDPTDLIELILTTPAGVWSEQKHAAPNAATFFSIPKSEFIKGLLAGPVAELIYTIKRSSGNSQQSQPLNFELQH